MSIQLISKRSSHHLSMTMSLLRPLALPHFQFPHFCTQIQILSTTPPDRVVIRDFFINKCGLTDEDITRTFKHHDIFSKKSTQNFEEVLELLNGCGLTTPAQIGNVVRRNPTLFFFRAERNLKAKLCFLRTFMKEEEISKIVYRDSRFLNVSKGGIKSAVSLLQRLGVEGQELSELLQKEPRLLWTVEEKVIDSFKLAEKLGFRNGSKMFAHALRSILGAGKENFELRLRYLSTLGFSEEQVSKLVSRQPCIPSYLEGSLKRKVDFLVKSVGLPLAELVKNPFLFTLSLETRIIPRFRVMEALKSMQEQVLKGEKAFVSIARMTEECFLEKYVNSNAQSSNLRDIYHSAKLES